MQQPMMMPPPGPGGFPPGPAGFPPGPGFPFPFPTMLPNPKALRYPKKPKRPPPEEPNHTLYVHNLVERKSKQMLRKELIQAFAQHGDLLDVAVKKNRKMKGQAFVVYKHIESAQNAIKELQGKLLFNKPMEIQYARDKSDEIAKLEGTLEENKKAREERKAARAAEEEAEESEESEAEEGEGEEGAEGERPSKRAKKEKGPEGPTVAAPALALPNYPEEPPHNLLFIPNVPATVDEATLTELFKPYEGFKELRLVRRGNISVAFLEYENVPAATVAKMALHGHRFGDDVAPMAVLFAKQG